MSRNAPAPKGNDRPLRHLTDDDVSTRGGALPAEGVPRETPDTQESLDTPDRGHLVDEPEAGHRVDENEGKGRRHATREELEIEADDLVVTDRP